MTDEIAQISVISLLPNFLKRSASKPVLAYLNDFMHPFCGWRNIEPAKARPGESVALALAWKHLSRGGRRENSVCVKLVL
jgi:hypothetical protein